MILIKSPYQTQLKLNTQNTKTEKQIKSSSVPPTSQNFKRKV